MTINLASASVASRAFPRLFALVAADGGCAVRAATHEPHVDEARRAAASPSPPTRLDDVLFGLAVTVLLLAVAVPWPAALSFPA